MAAQTGQPLLVSIPEASFQLSLPEEEILALIREGDLVAVKARGRVLVAYYSLVAFTRRAKRHKAAPA
jgi:hypothetical protein